MKSLLVSVVAATVFGVVMSLPFQRDTLEQLIPLARSLGATKFAHFVHEANLTSNFTRKAGNFTLFVPDNKAFHGLARNITGNKTLLTQLILFHSVNGTYNRSELVRNKKLQTLSGRFLHFNHTKTKQVFVNGVNITGFNKRASNGYIFLVSKVILQGSGLPNKHNKTKHGQHRRQAFAPLCRNGTLGRNCTNGNGTHGNFTHNPNNVHHPIGHGNGVLCVNGTWGRNCTLHWNGTHGNGSFCPNGTWGVNCTYQGNGTHGNGTHGNMTHGSIGHVLSQGYGQFSTLITDLMKTGVWSELERPQVTLLAPTNTAFSKLPVAYRNNLDNHANFLKSTMMYHILNDNHAPESLHQNDMVTSLGGQRIHVSMQNGHVHEFNRVSIMNVIRATNGIIYVLNGVLHLPSSPIV